MGYGVTDVQFMKDDFLMVRRQPCFILQTKRKIAQSFHFPEQDNNFSNFGYNINVSWHKYYTIVLCNKGLSMVLNYDSHSTK